jgi:hypothetical protein
MRSSSRVVSLTGINPDSVWFVQDDDGGVPRPVAWTGTIYK